MGGARWRLLLAAGWLALELGLAAAQTDTEVTPYQAKAAYLYKFLHFVRWPEVGETYVIGILGHDPLDADVMREIEARTLKDKRIAVRRFRSIAEYQPCHLLFISPFPAEGREGETAEERLRAAVRRTQGAPVLLVSDTPGFAQKGAMINLSIASQRFDDGEKTVVKMEINLELAKRAGLDISSQLLNLKGVVTIVRSSEAKGH